MTDLQPISGKNRRDSAARAVEAPAEPAHQRAVETGEAQQLEPPAQRVPVDLAGSSFHPASRRISVPAALAEALSGLSRRENVPLSEILLTGLQALLHRYTSQETISVGLPAAVVADSSGAQSLLVVAHREFADDPTFRELLARTRVESIDRSVFSRLSIDGSSPEEKSDLSRISAVLFGFGEKEPTGWTTGSYELALWLAERDGGLTGALLYDPHLFDDSTIARLAGHYLTLLEGAAEAPEERVGTLPLATSSERRQILVDWNDTRADFPRDPLPRLFEAQVERSPDRVAVEFQGRALTYRELDRRANGLARRLQELGVGPEVLVGLCVDRSAEMLVALLAILKAGGAYVPIDPAYPKERIAYILEDSAAPVVITERHLVDGLPAGKAHHVLLDEATEAAAAPPERRISSESLAYVIYTSGSTGRPKGVLVTHGSLTNLLLSMTMRPGISGGDALLAVTTLSFDIAGLELYSPLIVGGRLVVASREVASDAAQLRDQMERCGASVMQATPATWRMLVDSGWKGLPGLKVLCGGEAMPRPLARQLCQVSDSVWNLYGPTETTIWSSCDAVAPAGKGAVSIGRPIANTRMYVLDAKMRPVPVGVAGQLCIGGAGVARGYRNLPDLTNQKFSADPFDATGRLYRTGDLARYLPDGRLDFLGRSDDQVKIRGFRIELGEIETVLARHPEVRECVAVAIPDESGEKRLVAYVVARERMPAASELRAFVKAALPEYMVPSLFVSLPRLPLTPNGKVDRRALPAPTVDRAALEKPFLAPRDSWEFQLAAIWKRVLHLESVGVQDDFFELGGHSVTAGRLFADIQKTFGKNLPPTALLRAPTIELLAILLRGERETSRWSSLVPIQPTGSRPPLFCMHAGAGTVLYFQDLARQLGPDQPVYGLQAQGIYGGLPPHAKIEEMVTHYIREMRTVQPEGPYHLAGFCFGAVLAFAIAQQLRSEGSEVALIASLDGGSHQFDYAVRTGFEDAPAYEIAREWTSHHLKKLTALSPRKKLLYLAKKARTRLGTWKSRLEARALLPVGDLYRVLGRPLPEALRHTYFRSASVRATKRYAPAPYPGRMILFVTRDAYRDPHLGWDGWVEGGLEIHEISVQATSLDRHHAAFMSAVGTPLRELLLATSGSNGASLAASHA